MRISELKKDEEFEEIKVKIIWDKSEVNKWGIKSVLVCDFDEDPADKRERAYLDLKGDYINKFNHLDVIIVKKGKCRQLDNGQKYVGFAKEIVKVE